MPGAMHRLLGLSFALFIPFLAIGQKFPIEYGSRLQVTSRAGLETLFHAPFGRATAPAGIKNCSELIANHSLEHQAKGNIEFQAQQSTRARCLVMDQLRRAKPSRVSFVHGLALDAALLKILPPQVTITASDEMARKAAAAAANGKSYLDFDPSANATAKGPDELAINGEGFTQTLILWGTGDFTGDGVEDLLVQSSDAFTEGTYKAIRLFMLTRRAATGMLTVVRELI